MKKSILSVFLALLGSFWIFAGETGNTPIVVSPGGDAGVATIITSCPTFSWSAASGAAGYRVVVFQSPDMAIRFYEELAGTSAPRISQAIPGPALSWTLPTEQRLSSGIVYSWYVQALDGTGNGLGEWSGGRLFMVVPEGPVLGTTGNNEMERLTGEGVSTRGAGVDPKADRELDGAAPPAVRNSTETASVAFLGAGAGASNVGTSNYNTFIGGSAGYSNTTGFNNTFLGYGAGFTGLAASNNTFLGYYAGYADTTGGANTAVGQLAGYSNTTGNYNTLVGMSAGHDLYSGSENTFIGDYAGYGNLTGSGNVFIGNEAGRFETGSEKLYIQNDSSKSPLISGEFNN
jgi:hypothetical protein